MLTQIMLKFKGDVLSIDSFVRCHQVEESNNSQIQDVVECFEDVADAANCAIHLWHHTRKNHGDQTTVEFARGASSFIDSCRSVRILEKMTKKERDELLGIMPNIGQAGWYFRAFNGKRNFAPPTDQSDWFMFVSIQLHNWTSEFDGDGDNVGVVTPWIYPKLEMPRITEFDIERVLQVVKAGGPWRKDSQSKIEQWVGIPIAQGLNLNLADTRAKTAVKKLLDQLLRTGRLRVVDGLDRNGMQRAYVVVSTPSTGDGVGEKENMQETPDFPA